MMGVERNSAAISGGRELGELTAFMPARCDIVEEQGQHDRLSHMHQLPLPPATPNRTVGVSDI